MRDERRDLGFKGADGRMIHEMRQLKKKKKKKKKKKRLVVE